jgi:baseplate J-like protein
MLAYAKQAMPNWAQSSEGDFGVMLVELMAYMGDILSYYGDRISQEAYLPTATQLLSMLHIAATLGYIPFGALPASGTVTFVTTSGGPSVAVPVGTQVIASQAPPGAAGPPIYQTTTDTVVAGDGGVAVVEVVQGETFTMTQIGVSTGQPGQTYQIPQLGVQGDSVKVYVESDDPAIPTLWGPVSFLVDANSDQLAYALSTDSANATWVNFGDGQNGLIPGVGLTIWATYNVIVGAAGNVPPGSVDTMVDIIDGVDIGFLADGVTRNTSEMRGGSDAESIDSIRLNASQAFSAQGRAVSLQDYTNLAYNVPGVLLANAVAGNASSITLYVAGANYQAPSVQLVNSILDYFEPLTIMGVSLNVANPAIIPIDVGTASSPCTIVVKPAYSQGSVTTNVRVVLNALLSPPNVSFGQLLNVSDIYEAILGVDGVAYCIVPVFTREDTPQSSYASIQLRPNEFINVGQLYLSVTGGF